MGIEERDNAAEERDEAGGEGLVASNQENSSEGRIARLAGGKKKGFDVQEIFDEETGKSRKHIKAKKSDFIHNLIYLDGNKFDFTGREYLRQIYDAPWRHKVLVTGRQVEKSTMLANEIITNSCVIPYFKCLYVSTSHDQTRQFSNGKMKPWTEDSPIIQRYFQNSKVSKQVFEKSYTNGSITFLRSAFLNADRTRGISSDLICLDEIQDMLSSNIPVILETASHSKWNWRIFAGTPKTLDNATEEWWRAGSMCEWLVPCRRHSPIHYNYLDEKCIGKKGVICNKCGNPINPAEGEWVALSTERDVMSYRISQLMVPWIGGTEKGWKDLLIKYNTYSTGLFKNEVLGLSHDSATKPITRTELIACTSPKHPLRLGPDNYTRSLQLFAGIDWGEGSDGSERNFKGKLKPASYTVLTIGGFIDQRHFHVVFMKRYHGEDALPRNCVRDIIRICKEFGVKLIGVDWGHGWGVNDTLSMHFHQSQVAQFQYVGMQRERSVYDSIGHKIQLNRTEVMTDFFDELRARKWVFPPWEESSIFLKDVEHIFAEFRMKGDLVYDHKVTEPDDAAHSMIMCREAARIYYKGG